MHSKIEYRGSINAIKIMILCIVKESNDNSRKMGHNPPGG
jgi:hypothetical protein